MYHLVTDTFASAKQKVYAN